MRLLYSAMLYLLTPLILLGWLWRSRRMPSYRQHWGERFGWLRGPAPQPGLWIHAVSVGEVQAVLPLLRMIREAFPELAITVSTTTPTGAARLRANLGDTVRHCYAPLDTPSAVTRTLHHLKPKLLVLVETELWPNLLHHCHQRGIPVAVVNARLSARSSAGYARWPSLVRPMLDALRLLIAQDEADAARFISLGLQPARVRVSGNLKYDVHISDAMRTAAAEQRQIWAEGQRPVLLAASTHPGEESLLLSVFKVVREHYPSLLLVLVPRHIERGVQLVESARAQGWQVLQRSSTLQSETGAIDVVVADTLGELPWLLGAADAVVMGGSFVEHGGQNPLEAAAWGKPVIFGPSSFNFSSIVAELREAEALLEVSDGASLATAVELLLGNEQRRLTLGEAAADVVAKHRGASERSLQWLRPLLQN